LFNVPADATNAIEKLNIKKHAVLILYSSIYFINLQQANKHYKEDLVLDN